MTRIEDLLRRRIGLDGASIGRAAIHRVVRARMRNLGLKRVEDYRALLHKLPSQWDELVEAVVVTESWFFRDRPVIEAFVRRAVEGWLPSHPAAPLRVLSIPCAAGEEPYSLVMALLEAGVPPDRFEVQGLDLSARALALAQRAIYGKNSFRGKDIRYRARYFQASEGGFALAPTVRGCVRFRQANIVSERFLRGEGTWDFIFCRNLLIYLDRPHQERALAKLGRLLAPGGLLFVGPVEQAIALEHGFISANMASAFACRREDVVPRKPLRAKDGKRAGVGSGKALLPRLRSPAPSQTKEPALPRADLESARRLADEGRFKEAGELCEAYLRESRDAPQAYYLLGLVRDACGDATAMDCYRKALYLDPNHYDSLLQMALLLQKRGESARAQTFRSRAQRLKMNTAET